MLSDESGRCGAVFGWVVPGEWAGGRTSAAASGGEHPRRSVPRETIRGLILGALITTVFTAANVYLGLKVGLTSLHRSPRP